MDLVDYIFMFIQINSSNNQRKRSHELERNLDMERIGEEDIRGIRRRKEMEREDDVIML